MGERMGERMDGQREEQRRFRGLKRPLHRTGLEENKSLSNITSSSLLLSSLSSLSSLASSSPSPFISEHSVPSLGWEKSFLLREVLARVDGMVIITSKSPSLI